METIIDTATIKKLKEKRRLSESPSQRKKRLKRLQETDFQDSDSITAVTFSKAD